MLLEAAGDFAEMPVHRIANAQLVTLDSENVLTSAGNPRIRPEALDKIYEIADQPHSPHIVIATNDDHVNYIEGLRRQLPDSIPVLSGQTFANKKTSPEMFLAAAAEFGIEPINAVHIDDQLLSFNGARKAKFGRGILVKPYGETHHKGVKAGRVLDASVRLSLLIFDGVQEFRTDGIDG